MNENKDRSMLTELVGMFQTLTLDSGREIIFCQFWQIKGLAFYLANKLVGHRGYQYLVIYTIVMSEAQQDLEVCTGLAKPDYQKKEALERLQISSQIFVDMMSYMEE